MLEDQCNDNMQQRRDHAQQLLAATQAVLDKQAAAWSAACAAVGQLLTQLSEAHDRHKEGHATLQSGIKQALEMTQKVRLKSLTGRCVCVACSQLSVSLDPDTIAISRRPVSSALGAPMKLLLLHSRSNLIPSKPLHL